MSKSPVGGPANIYGILYQLLWGLLRGAEIYVKQTDLASNATSGSGVTLILEPTGGGGDIREHSPIGRRIQQLKTGAHSWSLQDVVTKVLPDLYQAVDIRLPDDRYELITEGWLGDWKEAYNCFTSLRTRQCPVSSVLAALDNTRPIPFNHNTSGAKPLWSEPTYTERSLFERIAHSLQEDNPAIKRLGHSLDTLHRNMWHLLGHFSLIGNQTFDSLQSKVDRLLLEIIPMNTDLPIKRDALVMNLARKASVGGARINPNTFFAENGLPAVPLSHWNVILNNAARSLERQLDRLGYAAEEDARIAETPETWPLQTPLLAVSGESGQGKSWWLYNLALNLAATNPIVLIASADDVEKDMRTAARIFANIGDQDDALRLERVASRLKSIESPHQKRWLYLLIDGVQDTYAARQLAAEGWEDWGIVLVVAGNPDAMRAFSSAAGKRGATCTVGDFTVPQLMRYLTDGDSAIFYAIPGDIRDTLRRPLLARLYRDITRGTLQSPKNEYELYARSWEEIFRNANAEERLAAASLHRLALIALEGQAYPWSSAQISAIGMDKSQLAFLLHHGALQEAENGSFRIWHDRLLNWAVADALVAAWRDGRKTTQDIVESVRGIWRAPFAVVGRLLGYVPMDVVWMVTRLNENRTQELLDRLLAEIENVSAYQSDAVYNELFTPMAEEIAPALVRRMEAQAADDPWVHLQPLVAALTNLTTSATTPLCLRFLQSEPYALLISACKILKQRPDREALEPLWSLLQDINNHEDKYQKPGTSMAVAHYLTQSCVRALKACATLEPSWVEEVILRRKVSSGSLASLAYILPDLPDGRDRSERCLARLRERLQPQHLRNVARIMYHFPDLADADWLQQQVPQGTGLLGAVALQALIRLDSSLALQSLRELSEDDLIATRHWCLLPLLVKEPDAVQQHFVARLQTSAAPLDLLDAFEGFEDAMDAALLDAALDALERCFVDAPNFSLLDYRHLWGPLARFGSANSIAALERLKRRRGSPLEQKLTDWMLQRSPRTNIYADHLGQHGIEMLYRIGGAGFTQVVNAWLRSGIHFGILDGLEVAYKRPDTETIELLRALAVQSVSDNDLRTQAYLASKALACAEAWEPLVEAFIKYGFAMPEDAAHARIEAAPLEDEAIFASIQGLSQPDEQILVGSLLAIGMAQRADFEPQIADTLEASLPSSDTEKAAIMALSLLTTQKERTAKLIASRSGQAELEVAYANLALLKNQSEASKPLLLERLMHSWDTRLAIDLLNCNIAVEQIAQGLHEALQRAVSGSPISLSHELDTIFHGIHSTEHKQALFTRDVIDALRELAFTPEGGIRTGAQESAIRALAVADPSTAYAAALWTLNGMHSYNREVYPALLVGINADKATDDLFDMMRTEQSNVTRAAIGRALRSLDIQLRLQVWTDHTEADRRRAACLIAQYQNPTDAVESLLIERLNDTDEKVFEAAVDALVGVRQTRRQTELLSAMLTETDSAQRWLLLDAAIQVGDVGDNETPWHQEWIKVYRASPYLMREYMVEAIGKRRKKIKEKQEKQDH